MLRAAVLVVLALGAVMAGTPETIPYMRGDSTQNVPIDAQTSGIDKKTSTTVVPTPTTSPTTVVPPTKASTTTVPPVPTTTPAPLTTPPTPPTTTPPPPSTTSAPVLPPEKGKWAFVDKNNNTCVIVQMAIQFNITYLDKNDSFRHALFDLPGDNITQQAGGSCGNETQSITLQWPSSILNSLNNMTIMFKKNMTDNKFSLNRMEFNIVIDANFPDANMNNTQNLFIDKELFTISTQKSYRCAKNQVITLEPAGREGNSTLSIKDLQVQAFATEKGSSFAYAEDCDYVDLPDIVPIAVGCALGGLVLIVLITYLVGRRNRQARGYLSM